MRDRESREEISKEWREALRRYMEERKWARLYRYGESKAREKGITGEEIEDIVDAHRR